MARLVNHLVTFVPVFSSKELDMTLRAGCAVCGLRPHPRLPPITEKDNDSPSVSRLGTGTLGSGASMLPRRPTCSARGTEPQQQRSAPPGRVPPGGALIIMVMYPSIFFHNEKKWG
ncbi:unnamed protein product [Prorocentrum cordatum]|uniref:Uncharacterized protein n=1 Tax=Prorocentrum cordatum TaxID=2364126 RepID=A0ABN9S7K2_9DINO|nr:unnamed protein product [Polarella glacialis]